MTDRQLRWTAVCVLVVSSALNYLDRTVFSVLIPTLRTEFNLSGEQVGWIMSAFSLTYALMSPVMGMLVDRIGLRWGAPLVVGLWSAVGIGTGFAGSLGMLVVFRALLGVAESGGIPVTGKGYAVYLEPRDRAMANAVGQIGITVGTMAAPLLVEWASPTFGWRSAFVISGLLGFVWIPLWLLIARRAPENPVSVTTVTGASMLRDRRFLALIVANMLAMTVYSLWLSWATPFLVSRYELSQKAANVGYAWIPPIFATLGAFAGGWLARRLIREDPIAARIRIALGASLLTLTTALAPLAPSPALATAAICVSLFGVSCLSVNYYSIPLDLFGSARAASAVSFLTGAFGLMVVFVSPQIGRWSDSAGWNPVCFALAPLPLVSALLLLRAFRKDDAVVACFAEGPPDLVERMLAEVRELLPDREIYVNEVPSGRRIGLAPTLLGHGRTLSRALRAAPHKVLAYNDRLERHHLRLSAPIASILFLRGVPLDRIWLRPTWLFPFKRDRSVFYQEHAVVEGRPVHPLRPRVAVLSPYFPWPLSHGGAVRIYNVLREASRDFDILLFSFAEDVRAAEGSPVLDFCARTVTFRNPRYREPRWASLRPPEVNEFHDPYVARVIAEQRRDFGFRLLQAEYTQMGTYGADVLVEHDVTFDLYNQIHARERSVRSWWDLWRWRRFESAAVRQHRAVVTMSEKDAGLLGAAHTHVIPNGVDLERFRPSPESHGARLLFVGSFAHFPNVVAFRWFLDEVWPMLPGDTRVTVIAGRSPELYWKEPITDPRVEFHGFISDVRPFYDAANVVIVPTRVSAGTNLKVLEALAMERAIVSTSSGIGGMDVPPVQVADTPEEFAAAIIRLLGDFARRAQLARAGRQCAVQRYGWEPIGALQRHLWTTAIHAPGTRIRKGTRADVASIARIQSEAHGASTWDPDTYFHFDVRVAERNGLVSAFIVSRVVAPGEAEILNVAVAADERRRGIGAALIQTVDERDVFLEVRESNTPAQSLYKKLGFAVVGRREGYYDDPPETALVMRRTRPT